MGLLAEKKAYLHRSYILGEVGGTEGIGEGIIQLWECKYRAHTYEILQKMKKVNLKRLLKKAKLPQSNNPSQALSQFCVHIKVPQKKPLLVTRELRKSSGPKRPSLLPCKLPT